MRFFVVENCAPDPPQDCAGRIDVVPEAGFNVGEAPKCARCQRFLGMLTWLPPYRVEMETWGGHYGDIARTGDDLIVSEQLMSAFKQSELRGLSRFAPVDVVKVCHRRMHPQEIPPRYYKAAVERSTTTIDQKASGYVWEDESKICPECLLDTLKRYRQLIISEETWNGDDIFFPRGGSALIASDRFRSFFAANQFGGMVFVPSEEASYDFFPWETQPSKHV